MYCTRRSAIVLSSGGLDSTTCLAIAHASGCAPLYSLSFDYGQRHRHELAAAARIAQLFAVAEHRVITIDLRQFGHSALTADIEVPKCGIGVPPASQNHSPDWHAGGTPTPPQVPITYVPARNTIFLSYALAWAEVLGSLDVFIGVNAIDYSGYPDCRPAFVEAFEKMANLATAHTTQNGAKFTIHAPLLHLSKAQIIRRGMELGVDYSLTHSCYDPTAEGLACGQCESCVLRARGFAEAGVADPTRYSKD